MPKHCIVPTLSLCFSMLLLTGCGSVEPTPAFPSSTPVLLTTDGLPYTAQQTVTSSPTSPPTIVAFEQVAPVASSVEFLETAYAPAELGESGVFLLAGLLMLSARARVATV